MIVARGLEVAKFRSLSEFCGLRFTDLSGKVDRPKRSLHCKRCQRLGHTNGIVVTHPGVLFVVRLTSQGVLHPKAPG